MTKNDELDFAARLKELESITAWFESENIDLDEGLAKFERGMELAASLKNYLQTVENRVEKIKQKFEAAAPLAAEAELDPAEPDLFS